MLESEDITIPAPWGHIAVKLWGKKENAPVLLIHGILENVGSFDRILQLLPTNFYYICIDLPGHGKSSHWPQFAPINTLNHLLVYKLVVDYFDRKKYILIGHSYGGQLGFIFTQMYPEYITKLIMIDVVFLSPISPKDLKTYLINSHKTYFTTMKKLQTNQHPEYTYEDALIRLMTNRRYGEISREAAEPILKRMMIPLGNGKVKLSLDQRLKFIVKAPFDLRYIIDFIKEAPVLCPVLIVLASDSNTSHIYLRKIIKQIEGYKNIRVRVVEGNHDVHNVHPERVAPFINEHLLMTKNKLNIKLESEDITIPAPWGHIAVKLWGKKENAPVLLIHGILENVGSFDRILQLLPTNFYYICIDLPGHGKSSHWPQFAPINTLNHLLVYKLVVDYFDRKKYILIGHSYGGQLGFIFTQMYPEYITKLIMIDVVFLSPISPKDLKTYLINSHKTYFTTMKKLQTNQHPVYTYEDALIRLMTNRRYGEISREAAEPILKRMMIPLGNGKVKLSLDQRLKFIVKAPFDLRYIIDFIKEAPVLCPVLIVLASDSNTSHIYLRKIIKQIEGYKNIRVRVVEGNHDVHNVHPERVAPFINEHLLMTKNKL